MAPKIKSRLVDQPPSASSSEEQEQVEESQEVEESEEEEEGEEQESGEESEEEEEEEEPKTAPPVEKKPTIQKPVQTPQKPQSSSESGTEDGSGSESESESGQSQPSPSASDFTVKPSVPAKAAAPSKPAAKRPQPQETQKEKDSRKKKPKIAEEEEKKAAATPRSLWSDEDQLALLKGIAEYKAQKGTEPNADMSAFHEFIKGKLQAEVSKSQLSDKLRRLKKKFLTNMKDGEDPVFSKGQDYLVFEYSKKIWGAPSGKSDAGTSNGVKENVSNSANGKAKQTTVAAKKSAEPKKSAKVSTFTNPKDDEKQKEEEKDKQVAVKEVVKEDMVKGDQQDFQSKYPRLAASFDSMAGMSTMYPNGTSFLKENMSLITSDKAKVLEEKWKKLLDDEAALMMKRLDLIAEHYRLVVDATSGK